VDLALYEYWTRKNGASAQQEITLLYGIVTACTGWLKKKYNKNEFTRGILGRTSYYDELFTRRRREIKSLADEALAELFARLSHHGLLTTDQRGALHFAGHKVASLGAYGHQRRTLKPMGKDYQPERLTYLESGKALAISGSGVHQTHHSLSHNEGALEGVTSKLRKIGAKDVDRLTPDDFRVLDELGRRNLLTGDVNYLKKGERFRYLCMCDGNGKLVDTDGNLVTTHSFKVTAYAMDRYGNLFAKDADPIGDAFFFNHSSFNAGHDVISAGTLTIASGVLTVIDNNSGHYKPGRQNLSNCLDVLAEEGVDLTKTIVNLYVFVGGVKEEHRFKAVAFLQNSNSTPMKVTRE